MLSLPAVCEEYLFNEANVSRLLSDTQAYSSLRSQQALMDVASRGAGSRFCRPSPRRSPARGSPSRCRRRESGSPVCPNKHIRFDSPASALKGSQQGFRK